MSWLETQLARGTERPYALAALAERLGVGVDDTADLALALGLNRGTVKRYRTLGLNSRQADEWAERVGLDAAEVWPGPEWVLWGVARVCAVRRVCRLGHPLDRVDSAGRRRCGPCPLAAAKRYRERKRLIGAVMTRDAVRRAPVVWLGDAMARRRPITAHVQPELATQLEERAAAAGLTVSAYVCAVLTSAMKPAEPVISAGSGVTSTGWLPGEQVAS